MVTLLLVASGAFFSEIGLSLGKKLERDGKESIYAMGFLMLFWGGVFFFLIALFRGSFVFALASLPTFALRAVLEIAQAHVTMRAIVEADRSTFSFIRVLTIPLLLSVDIFLGYTLGFSQIVGIGLITVAIAVFFASSGISKRGVWFVFFTAVNAVATISLFKYHITHFNSVEAEQGIITVILLIYFFIMARFITKENPFRLLTKRKFFFQSFTQGIGSVLLSFAYLFTAPSVIITAKRSFSILWATLAGSVYFKEKKLIVKILLFLIISAGLVLLVL